MSKYRIKFEKGEEVKFIGHLDVMRLFQRAIRRAGIPIAYSKGFNPHQLMAFANPLSLGMTSGGEYGDFALEKDINPEEMVLRLNDVLPDGIRAVSAVKLSEDAENAMASVRAAIYHVKLYDEVKNAVIKEAIENFLNQDEIIVMKKTKSSFKSTDIKPDIISISVLEDGQLRLELYAGSERNLRADLCISALLEYLGLENEPFKISYHRADLLRNDGEKTVPLNVGV